MLIKPLLAGILETALNQYLSLDEDAGLFLQPLAGRVIAITIEPFQETLYLCPAEDKIQVLEQFLGDVDTQLTGSLTAFGLLGLNAHSMQSVLDGQIKISGDTRVGLQFQQLFKNLDIDMEEPLSKITGDVIAHKIGNLFRSGKSWTQQSIETFRQNLEEFLQEETRDLPAKPEAEIFYRQVDELRSDFDRLQARINRLQQAANTSLK